MGRLRNLTTILLFFALPMGCGENKPSSPDRKIPDSKNVKTQEVAKDPKNMTISELSLHISDLKSRNAVEKDEFFFLQAMNKELCDKVQDIRSQCVPAVPLFGVQKILGCDTQFENNTSISHKFSVSIENNQTISFKLIADNNILSQAFSGGEHEIIFKKDGNETVDAPKFQDLTSFRLVAIGSEIPAIYNLGFKFFIDENLVFNGDQLIEEGEGSDKFYRINTNKLNDLLDSDSCRMSESQLAVIEQSIRERAKSN